MANIFNEDFIDFLRALYNHQVEYVLVGGYAVILHGYIRSTADMDIWANKTVDNYQRLKRAYAEFGAPIFSEEDFLKSDNNVWSIGREPNKIEILNDVLGLRFEESSLLCMKMNVQDFEIYYIHLKHLLQSKQAAGRYKDLADIEQLSKANQKRK